MIVTNIATASAADFEYTIANGEVEITGYIGAGGSLTIPAAIEGYPVTSIWYNAISGLDGITTISIPASIRDIKDGNFTACYDATSIVVSASNPYYKSLNGVLYTKDGSVLMAYPCSRPGSSYTIPNGVQTIGSGAFFECENLTAVVIPEGVLSIEGSAFSGYSIQSVNIPSTVTTIGWSAFKRCGFTSITLSNAVSSIGAGAFSDCSNLVQINVSQSNPVYQSIDNVLFSKDGTLLHTYPSGRTSISYTVPDGVTTIGPSAFWGTPALKEVTLPDSVTAIEPWAFSDCGLASINLPDSITSLGEGAFLSCDFSSIDLPNNITAIPQQLFDCCTNLTSIEIPDGVTSIETYGFGNCRKLNSVIIPASVVSIAEDAFIECDILTISGFAGSFAEEYAQANSIPFNDITVSAEDFEYTIASGEVEITGYIGAGGSLTIPETIEGYPVTSIWYNAISGLDGITTISIPASIKDIKAGNFTACYDATSIAVSASNPYYKSLNGVLYTKDGSVLMAYPCSRPGSSFTIPNGVQTIGSGAFFECENLTAVVIPEGVLSIEGSAFSGYSIQSVNIPSTVTTIGWSAFKRCGFTAITLSNAVSSIGAGAFSDCSNLVQINVSQGNPVYQSIDNVLFSKDGTSLHTYPSGRTSISYTVPDGVTTIGPSAFWGTPALKEVTLPDSVTAIEPWAFSDCGLASINLPDSITSLGEGAFLSCDFSSIDLPNNITAIPQQLFDCCTNLTSIEIPDGVTSIETYGFGNCRKLNHVIIPASVVSIAEDAFIECDILAISGFAGSFAEEYAQANSIQFNNLSVIYIESISIDLQSLLIGVGKTDDMPVTILPVNADNKTLSWTSSDETIATVGADGVVTGVKAGTATITATTQDGTNLTATCQVTVKQYAQSIQLSKSEATLYTGETETLIATVLPADTSSKAVSWTSSDETIATVDADGVVTGVKAGTATITTTTQDGTNLAATCQVAVKQYAQSIQLNKLEATLYTGDTETLMATVLPADTSSKAVSWTSSDETIATVDADGVVTGVKAGTVTITATTQDGPNLTATCQVTVKQYAQSIQLNKLEATLYTGETEALMATVLPVDTSSKAVSWTSSDETIATVDADGVVTGIKAGTATITATTQDGSGKSVSITVCVKQLVEEVIMNPVTAAICIGNTIAIEAVVLPEDASDKSLAWSSSDSSFATVDASGVVTAIKPGSIEITAESRDGSLVSAACIIEITDSLSILRVTADNPWVYTGTIITWTTTATGGSGTKSYRFELYKDGVLLDGGAYGAAETCHYTPTETGIYSVIGFVKDSTDTVSMKSDDISVYAPLSITSVNADKSSSETGKPIIWTTTATGGNGAKSYRFELYKDGVLLDGGAYGAAGTFHYTPAETGIYSVVGFVKDSTGTVSMESADVTIYAPLSIASVKADKTSVDVGTAITWTAAATGGNGTKFYLFKLYKGTELLLSGDYGASATYRYTPTQEGAYSVLCYVKDDIGSISLKSADVIAKVPLSITSVNADKASSVIGSPITWTAAATGGSGTKTYLFKLYKDNVLLVSGNYGTAKTFTHTPGAAGVLSVLCYAKDSTGTKSMKSADVTIYTPLSIASVKADKTSVDVGTAITWTAVAAGGNGTKLYLFKLYKGTVLLFSGSYGAAATYRYTPTQEGAYSVLCSVKDNIGNASLKSADVFARIPLSITSVKADKASVAIPAAVKWTAKAAGGSGTKTYLFTVYQGTKAVKSGKYSTANSFTFNPTAAGTYYAVCSVKDSISTLSKKSADVIAYKPLAVSGVKANKTSAYTGMPITWTTTASNGYGAKTYSFGVYNGAKLVITSSYSASAAFTYTPTAAGTYSVVGYVKDSSGTVSKKSTSVNVKAALSIVSVKADKNHTVIGSAINWTATATGGSGTKKYQFLLYKGSKLLVTGTFAASTSFKYTPTENGTYSVLCNVKDSTGTVSMKSANVIVAPLSITSVKADKTFPVIGSPITWTTTAAGGSGAKTYLFMLYKGSQLVSSGSYGSANTYRYTPTTAGAYNVVGYVKDASGTVSMKSAYVDVNAPLSIKNVTPDRTSADIGTDITWTTETTGGNGTKTYLFVLYKGNQKLFTGSYGTDTTYRYTPAQTGIYSVMGYVKDSTGTVSKKSVDVYVNLPLSFTSVTANKTKAEVGTPVTWTAAATGGSGTKTYRFELYKDDALLKDGTYAAAETFSYTPAQTGAYSVHAFVKDDTGTKSLTGGNVLIYDSMTITSVLSDKTSAQVGTEITFTTSAAGGSGPKSFRFELYKDDQLLDGGTYDSTGTFSFTPQSAGTYNVVAFVQDDSGTKSLKSGDVIVYDPLGIASVLPDHANADIGTAITWTTAATGGFGAKTYRFEIYKGDDLLDGGTNDSSDTFSYTPDSVGNYSVVTYVTDDTGTVSLESGDVIIHDPLTITSVSSDKANAPVGTEITWTAAATGGYGTKTYRFEIYKGEELLDGGSYDSSDTFSFTPQSAGTYNVVAFVQDDSGTKSLKSGDVIIYAPLSITSVTPNTTSAFVYTEITWITVAAGGFGTKSYRFDLLKDEDETIPGSYSTSDTFSYTPSEAGVYFIICSVKDSTGTVVDQVSDLVFIAP